MSIAFAIDLLRLARVEMEKEERALNAEERLPTLPLELLDEIHSTLVSLLRIYLVAKLISSSLLLQGYDRHHSSTTP